MNESFGLATIVDGVIAFTVIEAIALSAYRVVTGRGVALRDFVANMVSGLFLMLALRSRVHDAGVEWIALFLLCAGAAHGFDIVLRYRRSSRAAQTMPLELQKATR